MKGVRKRIIIFPENYGCAMELRQIAPPKIPKPAAAFQTVTCPWRPGNFVRADAHFASVPGLNSAAARSPLFPLPLPRVSSLPCRLVFPTYLAARSPLLSRFSFSFFSHRTTLASPPLTSAIKFIDQLTTFHHLHLPSTIIMTGRKCYQSLIFSYCNASRRCREFWRRRGGRDLTAICFRTVGRLSPTMFRPHPFLLCPTPRSTALMNPHP